MLRIRDPVRFWPPDPGSGIDFFRIPDLGSRNPNLYFWGLMTNFFLQQFKINIISILWFFWLQKKVGQQMFFHPSLMLLFLDPGSGMDKNQDPESGMNIPDPQHCCAPTVYPRFWLWRRKPSSPHQRNHQAERWEVSHRGGAREGGGHWPTWPGMQVTKIILANIFNFCQLSTHSPGFFARV